MKKNILAVAAIMLSVAFLSACNDASTTKETTTDSATHNDATPHSDAGNHSGGNADHDQMMKKMEGKMGSMKMSGDFDVDYANMMISHHQDAIEMSEMYLPKGKDDKLKSMAQNIVSAQKKEIEELNKLVANHKPAPAKEGSDGGHGGGDHNELMEIMNKGMAAMKGMKMSGDADKDFASMMIMHHQSAVDMSDNEISHGKHVEMKKFAQKVINDQTKEIKEFQNWLSAKK